MGDTAINQRKDDESTSALCIHFCFFFALVSVLQTLLLMLRFVVVRRFVSLFRFRRTARVLSTFFGRFVRWFIRCVFGCGRSAVSSIQQVCPSPSHRERRRQCFAHASPRPLCVPVPGKRKRGTKKQTRKMAEG